MSNWEYKKVTMVNDVKLLCSACNLSKESKRAILKDIAFRYAERSDILRVNEEYHPELENANVNTKKIGNKYWSEKALNQYLKNKDSKDSVKGLIFDHIVPKKNFVDHVIGKPQDILNIPDLKEFLDKVLVGCVITKEEDELFNKKGLRQKMPEKIGTDLIKNATDPWARYKEAGIVVCELSWNNGIKNGSDPLIIKKDIIGG